jgi:hypothetical protein
MGSYSLVAQSKSSMIADMTASAMQIELKICNKRAFATGWVVSDWSCRERPTLMPASVEARQPEIAAMSKQSRENIGLNALSLRMSSTGDSSRYPVANAITETRERSKEVFAADCAAADTFLRLSASCD